MHATRVYGRHPGRVLQRVRDALVDAVHCSAEARTALCSPDARTADTCSPDARTPDARTPIG
ncbi:MAG: hypothetical protein FWD75_02965 [Propionibacteriaceae bacterium]|nr:hypothetical protein [Propionibacteriaceae bacterium]